MNIIEYKLKNKSSSGAEVISNKLLKKIAHCFVERLTHIINCSFGESGFRSKRKSGLITPLFEKDDPQLIENLLPIVMPLSLPDIFEYGMLEQLLSFLEKSHFLITITLVLNHTVPQPLQYRLFLNWSSTALKKEKSKYIL